MTSNHNQGKIFFYFPPHGFRVSCLPEGNAMIMHLSKLTLLSGFLQNVIAICLFIQTDEIETISNCALIVGRRHDSWLRRYWWDFQLRPSMPHHSSNTRYPRLGETKKPSRLRRLVNVCGTRHTTSVPVDSTRSDTRPHATATPMMLLICGEP